MTKEMITIKRDWDKKKQQKSELDKWLSKLSIDEDKTNNFNSRISPKNYPNNLLNTPTPILGQHADNNYVSNSFAFRLLSLRVGMSPQLIAFQQFIFSP